MIWIHYTNWCDINRWSKTEFTNIIIDHLLYHSLLHSYDSNFLGYLAILGPNDIVFFKKIHQNTWYHYLCFVEVLGQHTNENKPRSHQVAEPARSIDWAAQPEPWHPHPHSRPTGRAYATWCGCIYWKYEDNEKGNLICFVISLDVAMAIGYSL